MTTHPQTRPTADLGEPVEAEKPRVLELYHASFPPVEQIPPEDLLARDLVVARVEGQVEGFAALSRPTTLPHVLLEYLAVDRGARSHGLGSLLLTAALAQVPPTGLLLVEVDLPTAQADAAYGDPQRRIRFYETLGGVLIDDSYVLDVGRGPHPFHLYAVPGREAIVPALGSEEAETISRTLRAEVYGTQEG